MTIYLAADHAGYQLKEVLKKKLQQDCHNVVDCGANALDENDDYPDFVIKAAELVARNPESRGVVIGGSGQGEAMVANRTKGVRAAVWYGGNRDIVKLSREHNDANMLSLGARFVTEQEALAAVDDWLATPFSKAERHVRRIQKY